MLMHSCTCTDTQIPSSWIKQSAQPTSAWSLSTTHHFHVSYIYPKSNLTSIIKSGQKTFIQVPTNARLYAKKHVDNWRNSNEAHNQRTMNKVWSLPFRTWEFTHENSSLKIQNPGEVPQSFYSFLDNERSNVFLNSFNLQLLLFTHTVYSLSGLHIILILSTHLEGSLLKS